ncbi:unnamed protein product [Absidia cylindrospora]
MCCWTGDGTGFASECSWFIFNSQTHQAMDGSTFNECQLNVANFNKKGKALKKLIGKVKCYI